MISACVSATSAWAATVTINDATGAPGATISVTVNLQVGGGETVAGTQNDFFFDPAVFSVEPTGEGKPNCEVNPEIDKLIDGSATFGFGFLKREGEGEASACLPESETCNGVRAIVLSTDNVDPIAQPLLYTCRVTIKPEAAEGEYVLVNDKVILSDPGGVRLGEQIGQGGTITVSGVVTACACDCNGDRRVTGTEITRCVNILGGLVPLAECAAADSDKNGRVTGTDITRGVTALGAGTNCTLF